MARTPRRARRARTLRACDQAVSDVLGEVLVVAVLLGLFAVAAVAFAPGGPAPSLHADVTTRLECGAGGWGTGDERVVVAHAGGSALERDRTRIRVLVDGVAEDHPVGTLGGAFADGVLSIGERWNATATVAAGAVVRVQVEYLHDDGEVGLWYDAPVRTRTCATS